MKYFTIEDELKYKIEELKSYERKLKILENEYDYTGRYGYYKESIHKIKTRINQIKQK